MDIFDKRFWKNNSIRSLFKKQREREVTESGSRLERKRERNREGVYSRGERGGKDRYSLPLFLSSSSNFRRGGVSSRLLLSPSLLLLLELKMGKPSVDEIWASLKSNTMKKANDAMKRSARSTESETSNTGKISLSNFLSFSLSLSLCVSVCLSLYLVRTYDADTHTHYIQR